jgi:hypothetical protein
MILVSTIQAGEYAKGDTATFYVYSALGKVEVCTYFISTKQNTLHGRNHHVLESTAILESGVTRQGLLRPSHHQGYFSERR